MASIRFTFPTSTPQVTTVELLEIAEQCEKFHSILAMDAALGDAAHLNRGTFSALRDQIARHAASKERRSAPVQQQLPFAAVAPSTPTAAPSLSPSPPSPPPPPGECAAPECAEKLCCARAANDRLAADHAALMAALAERHAAEVADLRAKFADLAGTLAANIVAAATTFRCATAEGAA